MKNKLSIQKYIAQNVRDAVFSIIEIDFFGVILFPGGGVSISGKGESRNKNRGAQALRALDPSRKGGGLEAPSVGYQHLIWGISMHILLNASGVIL